jgi:hypothetical protein
MKHENQDWFWGHIDKKWKTPGHRFYSYAIQFDDGDYVFEIGSKDLIAYEEFVEKDLIDRKEATTTTTPGDDERQHPPRAPPFTPQELYEYRCKECVQCYQKPCGRCNVCKTCESNVCCYQNVSG